MATQPQPPIGSFLPTTDVYDVASIYNIDITSDEFKLFLVRLRQSINNIAIVVNTCENGYYPLIEMINGQLFFPNPSLNSTTDSIPYRSVFRITINFGALPNTGTTSVAHGINFTSTYTATRIYGAATDTTGLNYIPLPYASPTAANNIELSVDGTNVNITTGSNRSNFNVSYVVLEYIKQ